jgi:hypothetical protein
MLLLSALARSAADTSVSMMPLTQPLWRPDGSRGMTHVASGVVRVDIRRVVRPVIHHFEANLDGHERTYVFHVRARVPIACVRVRDLLVA